VQATSLEARNMRSMKNRFAVGAAAMALAVGVTAPAALAQTTQVDQGLQVNQGNLVSALNNVDAEVGALNVLNDLTVTDVQVVNVEDSVNNNQVLNNVLNNNQTDVAVLQDFLNNSANNNNVEILNDALDNNDVNVEDVVTVNVLSDGTVVLFVQ
jgi:hypothetical protein